jgi:hypothetical protein
MTILYNDGSGNFNERQDIWVAGNQSRNADWDEYANVEQVEVGEFTGDDAIDIVIYQKNNPFKTNDAGAPAGEPGNVTIIENDGCNNRDWTIGARFTHFWVWDMTVGDADQDGNDDILRSRIGRGHHPPKRRHLPQPHHLAQPKALQPSLAFPRNTLPNPRGR